MSNDVLLGPDHVAPTHSGLFIVAFNPPCDRGKGLTDDSLVSVTSRAKTVADLLDDVIDFDLLLLTTISISDRHRMVFPRLSIYR